MQKFDKDRCCLTTYGTGLTVYRDFKVKTDETVATEPEEYVDLTALVNKTNAL